jgi:hypothetical protein
LPFTLGRGISERSKLLGFKSVPGGFPLDKK